MIENILIPKNMGDVPARALFKPAVTFLSVATTAPLRLAYANSFGFNAAKQESGRHTAREKKVSKRSLGS